jgi:hypothetical protein
MRSLALAATLLLAACPGLELVDAPVEAPLDPSADPDPVPGPAALTGTFQVTSQLEVPATVAAPGPLGDSLRLLHQLSVNPGGALLDMADAAGVPALGTLRLVLPASVEDRLEGWMNDYLEGATVNGRSPHDEIVALDDQVRAVLLDWDLRSTLELPASAPGTHAPIALVFTAEGEPIVVPVDATAPVTAGTGVTATVSWSAGGGAVQVAVGDHAMGIPFGHYALEALETVMQRTRGAEDLAGALDAIVDCGAMARSVADQCAGLLCVGHEAELTAICEGGVAATAARLEARILAIDYQAIHFISGTATVEGVIVDLNTWTATAASLTGGAWESTIDLGGEPEEATATFDATR